MVCGEIMTMPGLPKAPAVTKIDLDDSGKVVAVLVAGPCDGNCRAEYHFCSGRGSGSV